MSRTGPRRFPRRALVLVGLAIVGGCWAAAYASAAGTTLHYYNVQQTVTATDAAGASLSNGGRGAAPQPGYHLDYTGLDYPGNHRHHASRATASNHLACTFTSPTTLTCNTQIAIGGSLLLGNDVTATLSSNGVSSIPLNAGTGKYQHARGTVTVTPIANSPNADVTVTLDR